MRKSHEIKDMLKTLLIENNGTIMTSQVTTSNTLEQFRQQFNNLQSDVRGLESLVQYLFSNHNHIFKHHNTKCKRRWCNCF